MARCRVYVAPFNTVHSSVISADLIFLVGYQLKDLPPQPQPPPSYYYSSQQGAPTTIVVVNQQPTDSTLLLEEEAAHADYYMTMSVVMAVLCCIFGGWPSLVLSLIAICVSQQAQDAAAVGDMEGARKRAKASLILNVISIIVYVITLVIYAVILAVVLTSTVGHRQCAHMNCDIWGCVYVYYNC